MIKQDVLVSMIGKTCAILSNINNGTFSLDYLAEIYVLDVKTQNNKVFTVWYTQTDSNLIECLDLHIDLTLYTRGSLVFNTNDVITSLKVLPQ